MNIHARISVNRHRHRRPMATPVVIRNSCASPIATIAMAVTRNYHASTTTCRYASSAGSHSLIPTTLSATGHPPASLAAVLGHNATSAIPVTITRTTTAILSNTQVGS